MLRAVRLSVSVLTRLPVRTHDSPDRTLIGAAMAWAPIVGLAIGAIAAGVLVLTRAAAGGDTSLLPAALALASIVAMTGALHLDGLADTADGLGCYGQAQRALDVMRDGSCGPFGVIALVLTLATQAAALGTLAETGRLIPVVLAVIAGRASFSWCARRGVPAARPAGLGALVADSQPVAVPVAWWSILLAGGLLAVPGRRWQGTLAVALAALAVIALSAHTRRRLGGVTGDVLGATSELTTTVILAVCAIA